MNIYEATKKALAENKCIASKSRIPENCKIKPTNSSGNCIGIIKNKQEISKYGWQPCADDLISVDWEVID